MHPAVHLIVTFARTCQMNGLYPYLQYIIPRVRYNTILCCINCIIFQNKNYGVNTKVKRKMNHNRVVINSLFLNSSVLIEMLISYWDWFVMTLHFQAFGCNLERSACLSLLLFPMKIERWLPSVQFVKRKSRITQHEVFLICNEDG